MIKYSCMDERLDIEKALAYLTLDEKIRMLSGDGMWHTFATGELPRIRMSDGPNGLRMTDGAFMSAVPATCFPTASMLANSWDPALLYAIGGALGKEATALGVNLLLAPGVNIKRNPLGGRNFEYFSEDPLLAGEMGRAYIAGVQSTGVGACVKHFAANNQEDMRMYADSIVDPRALEEIYYKPFRIAMDAKPAAVMCAYNKLNGEYCSESKALLTDVLRGELGFDGVVLSDWGAVRDRASALLAGLDLAMPDSCGLFEQQIRAALESGRITEEHIDNSVRRILALTDDVYLEPYGDIDAELHDKLAYNAAAASLVMLKNDGILPLTKNKRIAVFGTLAECATIQGGGSSHVTPTKAYTPLEAFASRAIDVIYCRGYDEACKTEKESERLIAEALDHAEGCDCAVVFVGAKPPCEGADRTSLALPDEQNRLIAALTTAGHRVIAVLCSYGPVEMPWVHRVHAILYSALNGQAGALAAADALFGRINPRGKLAETFPATYDDDFDFGGLRPLYKESIFVGYRYYEKTNKKVLFPFGHGLSYSDIEYSDMTLVRNGDAEFDVHITLENKSVRDAYEIVQVYVSNDTGKSMCAKKQLAGYKKVFAEGQTTSTAVVKLDRSAFEHYDAKDGKRKIDGGDYTISVAASSADVRLIATVTLTGDEPEKQPTDAHDAGAEASGSEAPETETIAAQKPYPAVYDNPICGNITEADFAALLGAPVPPPTRRPVKGEFTLDSCIDDLRGTLIGKIVRRVALNRVKRDDAGGMSEQALVCSALYTPLSAVCAMSDGAMSLNTAKAIVDIANGKRWAGFKRLLKKSE